MQDNENYDEEKIIDVKSTLESFIQEEKPELSQKEAIKLYKEEKVTDYKKKKKNSDNDDESQNEDEEHLKRVKRELLESLARVEAMEKKIFEEKGKENMKNIKVKPKSGGQSAKHNEKVIEQMREKIQNETTRE